jgi:hypothetical protein
MVVRSPVKDETPGPVVELYQLLYKTGPMMFAEIVEEYPQQARSHAYQEWTAFHELKRLERASGAYGAVQLPDTETAKQTAWEWWIGKQLGRATRGRFIIMLRDASRRIEDSATGGEQDASRRIEDSATGGDSQRLRRLYPYQANPDRPPRIEEVEVVRRVVQWTPAHGQDNVIAQQREFRIESRRLLHLSGHYGRDDVQRVLRLGRAMGGWLSDDD